MQPRLTKATLTDSYSTKITVRTHTFLADEPLELKGNDTAPSPMELLCGALASCTAITLKMYLQHKKIDTDEITVVVSMEDENEHQKRFVRSIDVISTMLTEAIKKRIVEIANKCPVHKMLEQHNIITSILE